MEIELPSPFGYTIYSKSGCPQCDRAKRLVSDETVEELRIISCDSYLANGREEFITVMQSRTGKDRIMFPIIYHNGKLLGGFKELCEYQERMQDVQDSCEF